MDCVQQNQNNNQKVNPIHELMNEVVVVQDKPLPTQELEKLHQLLGTPANLINTHLA